ncbi:MAG: HypC/HybG/HupF family hydrogenase formation chaperone [Chitinophagaceae bacterium]
MCLAIPGKILSISNESDKTFRMGKVSFGGITKEVNLSMVKEAALGDYVLVHAGVAISKIDEEEAKITLEYLKQIGEMDELENKPD